MNTPVKYELAKLLKEKGFDEPTLLCYDKCDMLASYAETVFKPKNYNTSGYVKSAPTIAEVVMWLYEEHKLWIYIIYEKGLFHNNIEDTTHTALFEEDCRVFNMCNYKTPIEAYEAAIKYCLENII